MISKMLRKKHLPNIKIILNLLKSNLIYIAITYIFVISCERGIEKKEILFTLDPFANKYVEDSILSRYEIKYIEVDYDTLMSFYFHVEECNILDSNNNYLIENTNRFLRINNKNYPIIYSFEASLMPKKNYTFVNDSQDYFLLKIDENGIVYAYDYYRLQLKLMNIQK